MSRISNVGQSVVRNGAGGRPQNTSAQCADGQIVRLRVLVYNGLEHLYSPFVQVV